MAKPKKDKPFRFFKGTEKDGWAKNLADDPVMRTLAGCIANQQAAGFKNAIDLRAARCENCRSLGFNTGWGFFQFACGATALTTEWESGEPCPQQKAEAA